MQTEHPPDRGMTFSGYIVNVEPSFSGMKDRVIGSRDRIRVKAVPG